MPAAASQGALRSSQGVLRVPGQRGPTHEACTRASGGKCTALQHRSWEQLAPGGVRTPEALVLGPQRLAFALCSPRSLLPPGLGPQIVRFPLRCRLLIPASPQRPSFRIQSQEPLLCTDPNRVIGVATACGDGLSDLPLAVPIFPKIRNIVERAVIPRHNSHEGTSAPDLRN